MAGRERRLIKGPQELVGRLSWQPLVLAECVAVHAPCRPY